MDKKICVVMGMKKISIYVYVIVVYITLTMPTTLFSQANVADQQFIDNADQFSDQHGVRLRSVSNSYDPNLTDPNLSPLSIKEDADNDEDVLSDKKKPNKKVGFSFSDMAKLSKNKPSTSNKKKDVTKKKKNSFTFSNMANLVQKEPTPNRKNKL